MTFRLAQVMASGQRMVILPLSMALKDQMIEFVLMMDAMLVPLSVMLVKRVTVLMRRLDVAVVALANFPNPLSKVGLFHSQRRFLALYRNMEACASPCLGQGTMMCMGARMMRRRWLSVEGSTLRNNRRRETWEQEWTSRVRRRTRRRWRGRQLLPNLSHAPARRWRSDLAAPGQPPAVIIGGGLELAMSVSHLKKGLGGISLRRRRPRRSVRKRQDRLRRDQRVQVPPLKMLPGERAATTLRGGCRSLYGGRMGIACG
jgi:hypothetical protein